MIVFSIFVLTPLFSVTLWAASGLLLVAATHRLDRASRAVAHGHMRLWDEATLVVQPDAAGVEPMEAVEAQGENGILFLNATLQERRAMWIALS